MIKLRVLLSGTSGWTHPCTESSRSQQRGGTMVSLLVQCSYLLALGAGEGQGISAEFL